MNLDIVAAAQKAATAYDAPVAWIAALITKESNGEIFSTVGGERRPLIRWEGHYFDARLAGEERACARKAGLASPKAGAVKNPKSQADRWSKLIEPAAAINPDAAHESVSWGVGQVMGAHWKKLGYASVDDLVTSVMSGLDGQVDLMMRYLKTFDLLDETRRGDALGLARGYNGPARAHAYAADLERLARDYGGGSDTTTSGMLRLGMHGAGVRDLQALLARAGAYTAAIDGDFGPATKAALKVFQRKSGLTDDGVAGPETMRALSSYRTAPNERLAVVGPLDTREAKQGGTAAVAGLGALEVFKQVQPFVEQLGTVTDKLQALGTLPNVANYVFIGLGIAAGVLIAGGLVWAGVGYWRSRQTYGGITA